MLDSLIQQLHEIGISKKDKILLAVSGGVDSMVLFDLFLRAKQDFSIAHVNFSLRNKESDLDEGLVREIAEKNSITSHFKRTDTEKIAKENKLSIQEAAREIRYKWFEKLQNQHNYFSLVTAHHLDDSIETFFINLNRGTGIEGLSGIKSNKKVFRPLLEFSKEDIQSYADQHAVQYRLDTSNFDTKYLRNWFRHEVLEKWKNNNPSILNTMASNLKRFREAQEIIDSVIADDLDKIEMQFKNKSISLNYIKTIAHKKITLFKFFRSKGFSENQILNLTKNIEEIKTGSRFESKKYLLLIDRENLLIKEKKESSKDSTSYFIEEFTEISTDPLRLKFEIFPANQIVFSASKKIEAFNKDKLKFPLELRKWNEGDKMTPLGMKGEKKISDILIDEKISLFDKENTWVLCSNNSIVWLVGIKPSEEFKINATTEQALRIECQNL